MDSTSRRIIEHAPLVIVDFDGTLAHLQTDWKALKTLLEDECRSHSWLWAPGGRLDANLRRVRATHGENAFSILCQRVASAEETGFSPDRVNLPLIELLRDRYPDPLAVVTNNTRRAVTRILRHEVFQGMRPLVIGKEDVYESKPSPQGTIRACRLFVASPRATVFIGDSQADQEAAERAGIGIFLRADSPSQTTFRLAA